MENETWLVTGAAGFLGSHVVEQLFARSAKVIGVDDFSWGLRKNLDSFKANPKFHLVEADIRDTNEMRKIMERGAPKYVIHLAALHFIPDAIKNPTLTLDINVRGTQSILDAIGKSCAVVWFASTGDVYKKTDEDLREGVTPIEPFNIYGLSKYFGENLIALKAPMIPETKFVIGRIFNLIGTRETNPHILPEIIRQLKNNKGKLQLGNVWPVRDYVAVQDCAKSIIELCLKANKSIDTFNVCTGQGSSVEDLVKVIEGLLKNKIEIVKDPTRIRSVERARLIGDNNKLKEKIGWAPPSQIEAVLRAILLESGFLE